MIYSQAEFAEHLFTSLALAKNKRFYIAFSGGLDSTVLLHLMKSMRQQLGAEITALHVNHNLNSNSNEWASHCQRVCEEWQIPFKQTSLELADTSENTARDARYNWFSTQLESGGALLTAHHRQDRAETVLFNLMRGAGSRGLSSLRAKQEFSEGVLVRPLLPLSVEQIQGYAKKHDLQWVVDPSNKELHYARNRVRNKLIPVLTEFRPDAIQNIARAADNLEHESAVLSEVASADLAMIKRIQRNPLDGSYGLLIEDLRKLSSDRQMNLVRHWFANRDWHTPSRGYLLQLIESLKTPPASTAILQESGIQCRFYKGYIYAMPAIELSAQNTPIEWPSLDQNLILYDGQIALTATDKLRSLLKEQGDAKVVLLNRHQVKNPKATAGHSLNLKKWLHASALPTWRRQAVPILCLEFSDHHLPIVVVDQSVSSYWLQVSVFD